MFLRLPSIHQPEHYDHPHNIMLIQLRCVKHLQFLEWKVNILNKRSNTVCTKYISIEILFLNVVLLFSELKEWSINENYYHTLQTIIVHFWLCMMKH